MERGEPDIQVKVQTGPNGNSGTYQNFFNQIAAGNAPDLGQIEYDALPNFLVQDGIENIAGCADVVAAKDQFVPWAWNQVALGQDDAVYGIPQDIGPMALFYRKGPLREEWHRDPHHVGRVHRGREEDPRARRLHHQLLAVRHQPVRRIRLAGRRTVVRQRLRGLDRLADRPRLDQGRRLLAVADRSGPRLDLPAWTDEWNNAYNSSQVWTWNSAVWGANSISSGAPDTAGGWAVSDLPQWSAGENVAGNWGGSSIAVLKGSEHPYEATKFALWLNTSEEALTALNEEANLYPATTEGLKLPSLANGVDFYGGQKIYDVFAKAATEVNPDFVWGPTMTKTYADVSDGFKAAVSGSGTLADALQKGQDSTISTLESQSIPVKK